MGKMTTAPDNCIQVLPTRQSLGTKRFDVIRQTQKVTANTTNVTDSPRCPAELVFSDIFTCFYSGSKHTCSGLTPLLGSKVTKKGHWGRFRLALF